MTDEVLTTKEACSLLRVHRDTLRKLIVSGKVKPIVQMGKTQRFLKSDLLKTHQKEHNIKKQQR